MDWMDDQMDIGGCGPDPWDDSDCRPCPYRKSYMSEYGWRVFCLELGRTVGGYMCEAPIKFDKN